MKKSLTLLAILLLTVMSCSKQLEIIPEKPVVFVQTQTGTPIGGIVNTTITATGGTAILPSVGVKVVVPAGAMTTGSQLSIQQVSNILNSDEKAIRISGDWIKPISIEYQLTDSESGNYNIFVSMPTGVWVGAKKAKVLGSTMSVRLGPNSGSDIKGGRVVAKTYDLAFAKFFTIKPDRVALDLGKTQQFVAYAKEGFVPRKHVNGSVITSQEELNTYIKTLDAIESSTNTDDELVPLAPPKNATADDELVPIAVYAKEYPFSNTKEGYSRLWKINQGVGSVNSNGLYTAPNDEASKGKTAEVWFLSQNNKNTAQNLVAGANIRINDGLIRYKGTITYKEKIFNALEETIETSISSKFILTNSLNLKTNYTSTINVGTGTVSNISTNVESYSSKSKDGKYTRTLVGSCATEGVEAGYVILDIYPDKKYYSFDGNIGNGKNRCQVDIFCDGCFPKNRSELTTFYGDLFWYIPKHTYNGETTLSGSFTQTRLGGITATVTWNLVKE
jgi:hypothetical protein